MIHLYGVLLVRKVKLLKQYIQLIGEIKKDF